MGNVVSMEEWRKGNRSSTPSQPLGPVEYKVVTEEVIEQLRVLLNKCDGARASVGSLGTVRLREQAVVDSVKYRDKADQLAKEYGLVISGSHGDYTIRFK